MAKERMIRLSQAARELNVGISTITDTLQNKGYDVENKANSKITVAQLKMLANEFGVPESELKIANGHSSTATTEKKTETKVEEAATNNKKTTSEPPKVEAKEVKKEEASVTKSKLPGLKVIDKIDLESKPKPSTSKSPSNPVPKKEEPKSQNNEEKPLAKKADNPKKPSEEPKKEQVKKPEPKKETIPPKAEQPKTTPPEKKEKIEEKPKVTAESSDPKPAPKKEEKPKSQVKPESKPVEHKEKSPQSTKPTPDTPKAEPKPEVKELSKKEPSSKRTDQDKPKPKEEKVSTQPEQKSPVKSEKPVDESSEETMDEKKNAEVIKAIAQTLKGLTILDKIELPVEKKKGNRPVASSDDKTKKKRKRKKKRIRRDGDENNSGNTQNRSDNRGQNQKSSTNNSDNKSSNNNNSSNNKNSSSSNNNSNNKRSDNRSGNNRSNNNRSGNDNRQRQNRNNRDNRRGNDKKSTPKTNEISEVDVQNQIKATLAKMSSKKTKSRKNTRSQRNKDRDNANKEEVGETKSLKVTEFISANDLANLMDVSVNQVISSCMSMGMFVSINQRLDAEAITFIADEFGFEVEFIDTSEEDTEIEEEVDNAEDMEERAPIVTIMGHVDHGKTSLLDYIRNSNVTSSESGGITQHIGAYDVTVEDGRRIAFLDTPGHEAFTAMRARGAKVTDIVILVVAADDSVMPQTIEAINHARVADVPIVIAINKIDKDSANPDKIKEELSQQNILVESWGGKYQDQHISAKTGEGIDDLLEKVLLEAEVLELKANPNRKAIGTVIEASLDKGKGYVTTILVQQGTLKVGDPILAGSHFGKVKAMNDHRGKRMKKAGPSTPVQMLGLNGAPQAGDIIRVMENEREGREIASRREQILREQNIRATKGLTLEEIGRRRALGDFQELKVIVKGDVDGSVEALSDSLLKLSTEEIEVKIIHKGVGQISEADIMLASASEAIIVGFQVRPSANARRSAEAEKVQIKLYSVIYNAIEEVKDAMEGMLAPTVEEVIVGNLEVRETFKISKIGTVAGCYVTDGVIKKNNSIRLIRDGIVIYEGEIGALKRFKEDVMEVKNGFECGMSIKSFNDIKVGDVVESYEQREIKRTLS
ncbi:MAG: translation initiation factor IF-2 [Bacteroidota bacterium]